LGLGGNQGKALRKTKSKGLSAPSRHFGREQAKADKRKGISPIEGKTWARTPELKRENSDRSNHHYVIISRTAQGKPKRQGREIAVCMATLLEGGEVSKEPILRRGRKFGSDETDETIRDYK